jgi:hypothetical protein
MIPAAAAVPCAPPVDSARILPGHQFVDAYRVLLRSRIDAMQATRLAFERGPLWIRALLGLRNALGRLVGLKAAPARGFPVISQSPEEVLMGFDDKHLDFRVVVGVTAGHATVTTIVRCHNLWGRAYLAAVMPLHRAIAARMIESVA